MTVDHCRCACWLQFLRHLTFHVAIAFIPTSLYSMSLIIIVHNVSCSWLVATTSFIVGFEAIYLCIAVPDIVVALLLQCAGIIRDYFVQPLPFSSSTSMCFCGSCCFLFLWLGSCAGTPDFDVRNTIRHYCRQMSGRIQSVDGTAFVLYG